jgi:uncharacterized membrane protein
MNSAATLIAGFGLFENSPAVIIGAMLIAMLFGPIVGIYLNHEVNAAAGANVELLVRSVIATEVTREAILFEPSDVSEQR